MSLSLAFSFLFPSSVCSFSFFPGVKLCGTWMDPDQEIADKKAGRPVVTKLKQLDSGAVQEANTQTAPAADHKSNSKKAK